ncbi:Efflux pump vrtL [Psilocybe cubensis]|uniref:Major facilitator superfamily (MFS) profile domain-containing protein n=2 Tax=Psilocybe cubensis TaxID=181762 RepID=A0A8H8CE64_PSICU|nr:Efflux pump vrtL [Psilocybe cubensis]KAH9476320.1 Efflux pump vrtL [Psilocybe cubensis]
MASYSSGSTGPHENRSSLRSDSAPTLPGEVVPEDVNDVEVVMGFKNKGEKERESREVDSNDDVLWVNWDGPSDPLNPKNWSYKKKWAATIVVSSFTFISPVSSSMVAPATEQVAQKFGITSTVLIAMTTSVFVLGYAVGPLFLGPLSEIYGRSRVLQWSNLFYLIWNIACGFAQSKNQLIIFRLLAGLGGSAPLSIGGGVLGDIWHAEERGRAIAIYSLAPLLGPVIGPVCGGWIAERSTWRWVFWSTSIVDVLVQLSGLFFLRETFAPFILEQKAKAIRQEMEQGARAHREVRTIFESAESRSWQRIFAKALTRPFQLFAFETIVQILGVYMAFVYGIFYLFLTTIPVIFRNNYHEGPGIGGLHYIALGLGLSGASQLNARFMDRIYVHFKKRNNGVGEPEFRLPTTIPGSLILPFGLLLSGWAAEKQLHWVAVDIGTACVGGGMILVFQGIQTYVVDTFTLHAASALAAVSMLRSLAGFGFPLFAPAMYAKLGYGKGNTILAALAIVLGCPAPLLLWKYGKRIRMSSRYASKQTHPRSPPISAGPTLEAPQHDHNHNEKKSAV